MQIQQIHFDEVFDAQPVRGDFSFTMHGQRFYGANLGKNVMPNPGTTFAVAFAKIDDWTTVLGWRDLSSNTVRLKQPNWMGLLLALHNLITFGPLLIAAVLAFAGESMGAGIFATMFAVGLLTSVIRSARRNRIVEQALLASR